MENLLCRVKLTVPLLEDSVQVTVTAGAQPGETLRLRGKGLPIFDSKNRGDLNLRIVAEVPERLSAEESEPYAWLRRLGGGKGARSPHDASLANVISATHCFTWHILCLPGKSDNIRLLCIKSHRTIFYPC